MLKHAFSRSHDADGGATAFATLLSKRYVPAPGERVGVLLCGANTDAVRFD